MLGKIKCSALEEKDAKRLRLQPFTREQLIKEHPQLAHPAAGFVIPYFDITGKLLPFFRYRYLENPVRKGFDAITQHKILKYTQPSGASPRAYFSPLFNWSKYLEQHQGEKRVIFITEGELKANCGAKHALPVIGLGGVWNFKSSKELLINDLEQIEWQDATVYIIYDSDARSNPQVIAAENALAAEMLDRGAKLHVVRIPQLQEHVKVGMDDFIVTQGKDLFLELVSCAEEWVKSKALYTLNEKVVFVHDPGIIAEIKRAGNVFYIQRMSAATFANSIYANTTWTESVFKKNKERVVRKSAAHEWIKWPHRAEVTRTTYLPGQPRIVKSELNTWPGWGLSETIIKPGSIKLWRELVAFLFDGATIEDMQWFERWLAYPLQHPGTKLCSAVVLWGLAQGTGKTLIGATMSRIYGSNFKEISDRELLGSFNEWAENRQFIMGDEITGGDKRGSADKMKSLITQRYVTINPKFVSPYIVPDCINYYFTSNHPDSFFLEDHDRRYFVHEVRARPLPDTFYQEYDKWYRSDAVGALFYHLLTLDLGDFNPNASAPVTGSKAEMLEMGRSELGAWVAQLRDNPEAVLKMGEKQLHYSLMTTKELLRLFDPEIRGKVTEPGMGRELKRGGFVRVNNGGTVRTQLAGPVRLWAVRDREHLSNGTGHKALADLYDRERATKVAVAKF